MSSIVYRGFTYLQPYYAGSYRVIGSVKRFGTPLAPGRWRVRLLHQFTGRFVRETWSDAVTGAYAFNYLAPGLYSVYALDHYGLNGGTIETDIVAEPMP